MTQELNRRQFAGALTGIVVAFSMTPRPGVAAEGAGRIPAMLAANPHLDAWLRIDPAGTVSIFTGRVELGQGNTTALAQIAAEELDVAIGRIRMIPVDTARSPNEGATAGSNSIQAGGAALRAASAQARAILIARAAQRLNAPAADFMVDDGTILSRTGAGKLTYWELAENPFATDVTNPPAPKPASAHHIVGHDVQRLDIPAKVMGQPAYVQDLQLPGMLHGRIVRPPSYDAELISVDEPAVRRIPGVVAVVRNGRFLGVVAQREEQAIAAREALIAAAQWRIPESLPDMQSVHEFLQHRPDIDVKTVDAKTGPAAAVAKTVSATYRKPYLAHASIGPSCAVAGLIDGVLTVWSHTQGPVSAPRRTRQSAEHAAGKGASHSCAGVRLLRAQWRRRCRARCGTAFFGSRRANRPGAVDAGRRICLGAVRLGHDRFGERRTFRRRNCCELAT